LHQCICMCVFIVHVCLTIYAFTYLCVCISAFFLVLLWSFLLQIQWKFEFFWPKFKNNSKMSFNVVSFAYMVQVGSQNNIRIISFHIFNSQIWLYWLRYYHQLGYITKYEKNKIIFYFLQNCCIFLYVDMIKSLFLTWWTSYKIIILGAQLAMCLKENWIE
jgi:hypothetical protein